MIQGDSWIWGIEGFGLNNTSWFRILYTFFYWIFVLGKCDSNPTWQVNSPVHNTFSRSSSRLRILASPLLFWWTSAMATARWRWLRPTARAHTRSLLYFLEYMSNKTYTRWRSAEPKRASTSSPRGPPRLGRRGCWAEPPSEFHFSYPTCTRCLSTFCDEDPWSSYSRCRCITWNSLCALCMRIGGI